MTPDLDQHLADAVAAIAAAPDLDALRIVDADLLGKQSVVTTARKALGAMDVEERKVVGQRLNDVRAGIQERLEDRRTELEAAARSEQLESERLDLAGRKP